MTWSSTEVILRQPPAKSAETHDDIMVVFQKSQYRLVLEPLPEVVLNNLFLIPK